MSGNQQIVSAAAWSIGAGLLGRALGLVATLVVARYLSPDIVGEVTVATVIALTGNWISAWGCGQYVIVHGGQGRPAIFAATLVYLCFGVLVLGALWLAAPFISQWLSAPRLVEYLPGALLGMAIRRVGAIPDKLLARELRFRRIAIATGLGDIVYALVAIALVSATSLGGHAMIIAFIAQSCAISAALIAGTGVRGWLSPVPVTRERLGHIFRFGAPVTAEITLSEGARYWDKPLMLRVLGAEAAGTYNLAFSLAHLPALYVGGHVGNVLMPAIVRAQPHHRAGMIVRALALTAVVLCPMAFGLAACAQTLVPALLPPAWAQVAPLLSVMAVTSVLGAASFMLASFLAALGENTALVRIEAIAIATLAAALVFLSRWGVVAASFAVGIALVVQFALSASACRRHGLSLNALGGPLFRVVAACLIMVAGVLMLRWQLAPSLRDAKMLLLFCEIAVGAIAYAVCLRLFGRGLLQDVSRLLSASGKAELQRVSTALQSAKAAHD
ncbi:MAG: oligosaccharide flippase family protein [Pseudoxanthomonas sp.]